MTIIDMTLKNDKSKCDHKWELSGFYKHNPHFWCSVCYWYLDLNEVNKLGFRHIFDDLLKNNNPNGYYL